MMHAHIKYGKAAFRKIISLVPLSYENLEEPRKTYGHGRVSRLFVLMRKNKYIERFKLFIKNSKMNYVT